MRIMKSNKKINREIIITIMLILLANRLGVYFFDRYGFWPVILTIVGFFAAFITLVLLLVKRPEKTLKKRTKEIQYTYSREVAVPPEFLFSMFYDADFYQRVYDHIDIYIDREEVGGHIVSTFHSNKGIQTNYIKITQWDPPFLLGTEITIDNITTIHNRKLEKTEKGTRFTVHSQIIYTSTSRLALFIFSFNNRKLDRVLENHWNQFIKEAENEYEMRKDQQMAL